MTSLFDFFDFLPPPLRDNSIADHCVALVTEGTIIGIDDRVHIELDRSHTVLSANDARHFATELKRIAHVMDPLSQS